MQTYVVKFKSFKVPNKTVAPGKFPKINKRRSIFIPDSKAGNVLARRSKGYFKFLLTKKYTN